MSNYTRIALNSQSSWEMYHLEGTPTWRILVPPCRPRQVTGIYRIGPNEKEAVVVGRSSQFLGDDPPLKLRSHCR